MEGPFRVLAYVIILCSATSIKLLAFLAIKKWQSGEKPSGALLGIKKWQRGEKLSGASSCVFRYSLKSWVHKIKTDLNHNLSHVTWRAASNEVLFAVMFVPYLLRQW